MRYQPCMSHMYNCVTCLLFLQKNILKPYCDHLATLLDVKWFSPKQNKAGKIELTGLELPHSVVASIRPLPVIFSESNVHKKAVILFICFFIDYKTEAILYSPGVSVTVNIDITNNTGTYMYMCPCCVCTCYAYLHVCEMVELISSH